MSSIREEKWELVDKRYVEASHPQLDDWWSETCRLKVDSGWLYRYRECGRAPVLQFVPESSEEGPPSVNKN